MATILSRVTGSDGDLVMSLSNEQIARTITIGSSWSWIRLGWRFETSMSSVSVLNPIFAAGLCAGTSSLYADATTGHFIGVDLDSSQNLLVSSIRWDRMRGKARIVTKINNTTTIHIPNFDWSVCRYPSSSSKNRIVNFLDFIRPASDPGNMLIVYYYMFDYDANYQGDAQYSHFYSAMTDQTASIGNYGTYFSYASTSSRFPVSESVYGSLDTVNIYWNKVSPGMELSDIALFRFA